MSKLVDRIKVKAASTVELNIWVVVMAIGFDHCGEYICSSLSYGSLVEHKINMGVLQAIHVIKKHVPYGGLQIRIKDLFQGLPFVLY